MALCCIHLPSKPLKNKLFAILCSINTTNKHKQNQTMLRDNGRTKNGNILQSKLQTLLCTRTFFCMHHLTQGGLGRTRWQKMHTNNFSPGSPQNGSWFYGGSYWTFQRHTRLLTTRGLNRFQRKDVQRLPQTTRQRQNMAYEHVKRQHAQGLVRNKQLPPITRPIMIIMYDTSSTYTNNSNSIANTCNAKKMFNMKRFQYIHIISQQHHVINQIQVSELTGNKQ